MQDLPSEVLYSVLGQLEQRSRVSIVPLVCQKWRALAAHPDCPFYETLRVQSDTRIDHLTKVLSWTLQHGAAVQHLHIFTRGGQFSAHFNSQTVPLWSSLPNLTTLSISSGAWQGANFGMHNLQHLHFMDLSTNLRQIILNVHVSLMNTYHLERLHRSLSKLVHLTSFHLSFNDMGNNEYTPPELEEIAQLTRLSHLCLPCLATPPRNLSPAGSTSSQGLARLTGLTQLALGQVSTMPDHLAALQNLQQLMLGRMLDGSWLLPADIGQCMQLSYLQLSDWPMPAERAWQNLSASLQALASLRCLVLKGMFFSPAFHRIHWRIPRQVTALSITQSSRTGAYFPHDLVNHPSLESLELSLDTLDTLPTGRYLSTLQLLALRDIAADNFLAGTSIRNALPQATLLRYLLLEEGRKGKGNIAFAEAEGGLRARKADGAPGYCIMKMPYCINQQDPHIKLQGTDARLWPFRDFDWEARGMRSQIFHTAADGDI